MRLDKFLKTARLVKRRTLSKEVCDRGMVSVNGRTAKAGTTVNIGDVVELQLGSKTTKFEIIELAEHVPANAASTLYRLIEE